MKALKEFQYTHDGFTLKTLAPGDDAADVPADAVPGLVAEGYLGDDDAAFVTKVDEDPVETGEPVLTDVEVHADLEALGVEFDPRDDLATKTALRDQARAARDAAAALDAPEAEDDAAAAADAEQPEAVEAAETADAAADAPEAAVVASEGVGAATDAAGAADAQPNLSPAQEKALDRDGDGKAGGSKKKGA